MTAEIERLKQSPVEFAKQMLKEKGISLTPNQEVLLEAVSNRSPRLSFRCGERPHSDSVWVCAMASALELKYGDKHKEDYRVRVQGEFVKTEETTE